MSAEKEAGSRRSGRTPRERRFSLTMRASNKSEHSSPRLKNIFGKKSKEPDEDPRKSLSRSSQSEMGRTTGEGSGDWPAPGKVSRENSDGVASNLPGSSRKTGSRSVRSSIDSLVLPNEADFVHFSSSFEATFAERILQAAKAEDGLSQLYRTGQSITVHEFDNSSSGASPAKSDGDRQAVLADTARAALDFYSRPWKAVSVGDATITYPGTMPLILDSKDRPEFGPRRNVFHLPKVPFQAEGGARHFLLNKIRLRVVGYDEEPVAVSVSVYDREMGQKVTSDVCFMFTGPALEGEKLAPALKEAASQRARPAVFSVGAASRDILFVFILYRLHRPAGDDKKKQSGGPPPPKKDVIADSALSEIWEPFGLTFCPTLRETDGAGYVSARGGPAVKALEPLSGHIELNTIFEFESLSREKLLAMLNNSDGASDASTPRLEGGASIGFDVEVNWSQSNREAFLDGLVSVAQPFSKAPLTVSVAAKNTLFVYPLRILGINTMFPADANIVLKVSFLPGGLMSPPGSPLKIPIQCSVMGCDATEQTYGWTAVSKCKSHCGEFSDEVRLELPPLLESHATLVFEVVRIGSNLKQEPVARLNIALFSDHNRFLANGNHSVLLGIKGDNEYASITDGDTLNLPTLRFGTRFESSIYLPDLATCTAIKHLASPTPVISNIANVPRPIERVNFPIILSGLLRVVHKLNASQPMTSLSAFCEVLNLLDRLHMVYPDSSSAHHPFLLSYASHVFTPPGKDFAEVLVEVWLDVLTQPPSHELLEKMTLSRTWVLVEILMKSIVLTKDIEKCAAAQDSLAASKQELAIALAATTLETDIGLSSSPSKPASVPNLGLKHSSVKRSSGLGSHASPAASPQTIRRRPESPADPGTEEQRRRAPEDLARSIATLRQLSPGFESKLASLVGKLLQATKHFETAESAELSILEIGKMLRVAFSCLNRGFCLDLLRYVLACLDALGMSASTSHLMTVVYSMEEEDYLATNMPGPLPLGQLSEYETESWNRFPLVGILVERLKADVVRESVDSSNLIWLLVALLARHEKDALLETKDPSEDEEDNGDEDEDDFGFGNVEESKQTLRRQMVTGMYFQFVHMALDMYASSQLTLDASIINTEAWFTCSLYILTNMPKEMLNMWFFVESVPSINAFLDFLAAGCKRMRETPAATETCVKVLNLVSEFASEALMGSSAHAPHVFALLHSLFDIASELQSEELVTRLFATADTIAGQNLATMFDEQHAPYVQMLVIPTITMCNSAKEHFREQAAKFLWSLIQSNDSYRGTFVQVRLACTIAISRLVTEKKAADTYLLKKALDSVVSLASSARLELREQISEMMNRLFEVLKSTVQLSTFDDEPEMKVDICFRISEGYSGSPDLRVTWLKILGALHKSNKDFSEAAQAYLVVAYLIAQYLALTKKLPPGLEHAQNTLLLICPYLNSEGFKGITQDDVQNNATALRLEMWTLDGFGDVLFESAQLLEDAGLHEWSISCYNMCIALRTPQGQHLELLKAYAGAQMACKNLLKSAKAAVAEIKFFRVRFVGASFGPLNGKAFIYRGDSSQRLMDFSNFLQKRCQDNAAAYGASQVELLGNDKETKGLLEQKDILYLQIARVYPTTTGRVCREFLLDMAFSDEKKQQQMVATQGRKKLFFTTALPFPAFARRAEITDTRTVILTPLQNALQLMEERVTNVREAVASNNPTVISGMLFGNVLTVLNEGPEAIAAAFLGESAKVGDTETDKLRGLVQDFVRLTGESLELHGKIRAADMAEWQVMAEEKFAGLKERLDKFF